MYIYQHNDCVVLTCCWGPKSGRQI